MSTETDRPPISSPTTLNATDEQLPFALVPLDQTLAKWVCPACTGVVSDQPRACPRCGRDFVRGVLASDDGFPDREMRSTARLFWLALLLGLPLIALGTIDVMVEGRPIRRALGDKAFLGIQAILCTPIVVVCGAPFFVRAWRSVRTRQLNLYTLIGLGAGAAYVYSLFSLVYVWSGTNPFSRAVPADANLSPEVQGGLEVIAPPHQLGTIDSFFESAAMIVLLVLLGQVLEIRGPGPIANRHPQAAASRPGEGASRPFGRERGGTWRGRCPPRRPRSSPPRRAGAGRRHHSRWLHHRR